MAEVAVDIQGVSKRFRLYHQKYTSLKERVIHAGRIPYTDLWALKDVAFEVDEGDTVGILGRNGSGKSTLLKCVCGVLQPTEGQVVVRGRLAGLLELGAGFQPDLTGRQNIYLNGSLLGLSQARHRPGLRRDRGLRRARTVHRQPGEVLLVGHVRPAGLRRRRQRRPRRPRDRRGAGGRRRAVPAQVPRPGEGVPDRGANHHLRVPLARPGALDLQQGGGAERRAGHRPRAAWRGGPDLPREPARGR